MADRKTLQADQISGHSGPAPGLGVQRDLEVCKLIDTTTCIGCKAVSYTHLTLPTKA